MDLKEFTSQTLTQIVEGVNDANSVIADSGAYITTEKISGNNGAYLFRQDLNVIEVNFDVAITTSETEGVNGGGGLKVVGIISAGGNAESKIENQTISRIKYTLPLVLAKK